MNARILQLYTLVKREYNFFAIIIISACTLEKKTSSRHVHTKRKPSITRPKNSHSYKIGNYLFPFRYSIDDLCCPVTHEFVLKVSVARVKTSADVGTKISVI